MLTVLAGLSECFEVDGCWKKVAVCAGEVARKIKLGTVGPEKRWAIGREHSRGVRGSMENFEIWSL